MNINVSTQAVINRYHHAVWQMVVCLLVCDKPMSTTIVRYTAHLAAVGLKGNRIKCVS
ncbi:MAG: hypothetical protein K6L75_15595 [Cellvibrionaceae bacterium]